MKHANISIFIPHIGCPHRCSFCDQRTISGAEKIPHGEDVKAICEQAVNEVKSPENTEIAFFGGSFTAIPRAYMKELLESAYLFIKEGHFRGIRISTRPDCIDEEVLSLLKSYGVTAIELGTQSMSDKVLMANERGHSVEDVEKSVALIRSFGFELGLQIMVGLYKSHMADEAETLKKVLEIKPDTVRIYPVVILKNTRLGELYQSGEYTTFTFDEVAEFTAKAVMDFESNGIKVIKCGLHSSEFVERDMIGGFYHPSFREICESLIYREKMTENIAESKENSFIFAVNPTCISKALGHKKSNYEYFANKGITIKIVGDESVPKYEIRRR